MNDTKQACVRDLEEGIKILERHTEKMAKLENYLVGQDQKAEFRRRSTAIKETLNEMRIVLNRLKDE